MKKNSRSLLLMVAFVLFFAGSIWAKKIMDGVPQNLGIKDVVFSELNQGICRGCHGDTLADRHHGSKNAKSGNCVFCHKVSTDAQNLGVDLTRDCLKCHLKSPHHQTEAAKNNKCTDCHDTPGLSPYTLKVPSYIPTLITPTKSSCKNCHLTTAGKDKVYGFKETHHAIGIQNCDTCHTQDKNSEDVRICERCHDVKSLHMVKPHVEPTACFGCHGDKITGPEEGKKEPVKKPKGTKGR